MLHDFVFLAALGSSLHTCLTDFEILNLKFCRDSDADFLSASDITQNIYFGLKDSIFGTLCLWFSKCRLLLSCHLSSITKVFATQIIPHQPQQQVYTLYTPCTHLLFGKVFLSTLRLFVLICSFADVDMRHNK